MCMVESYGRCWLDVTQELRVAVLCSVPTQDGLDRGMNPPPAPLRQDTFLVQSDSNTPVGQPLLPEPAHADNDLLLAGVFYQPTVPTEVPAERGVPADPLAACPFDAHGAAGPFPDHGTFQLGENAGHLSHCSPVRTGHVEIFCDRHE